MSRDPGKPPQAASVAALTARIARGDEAAFADFHAAWYQRCLALAARVLPPSDRESRHDVTQEVMLRVARKLPVLAEERALAAWLARVVYTVAIDHVRSRRQAALRERAVARVEHDERDDGARVAEQADALVHLRAALAELDPVDRELILARHRDDASFRELGEAFGITGNAAAGRIRRGLLRLRGLLPSSP